MTERAAEAAALIESVVAWAREQPGTYGLVLVGSYARNAARPDSDVDFVLLSTTPDFMPPADFGPPIRRQRWGDVWEYRFRTRRGLEFEINVTDPGWPGAPEATRAPGASSLTGHACCSTRAGRSPNSWPHQRAPEQPTDQRKRAPDGTRTRTGSIPRRCCATFPDASRYVALAAQIAKANMRRCLSFAVARQPMWGVSGAAIKRDERMPHLGRSRHTGD
ncbi:nucleotidyltransferase family protein [Amycolatopsis sp. GM8]|uniref:nucleotidyltransferase family protein n=1 Tax=Amycolatopsis sp. GM8 TaxID=2896530 RepID=UPI0035AC07AE